MKANAFIPVDGFRIEVDRPRPAAGEAVISASLTTSCCTDPYLVLTAAIRPSRAS
jgi:hypothetical protein